MTGTHLMAPPAKYDREVYCAQMKTFQGLDCANEGE